MVKSSEISNLNRLVAMVEVTHRNEKVVQCLIDTEDIIRVESFK